MSRNQEAGTCRSVAAAQRRRARGALRRRWRSRQRRGSGGTPTTIGKGEGSAQPDRVGGLHDQPQWVKPFEKQTGCKVNAKYAGSSNEMVSLMRANGGGGAQYDMVSASGDADLRLIYGGDVQPVNVDLIPELEGLPPGLQVAVVQHDRRHALRRLAPVGAEHAALQHEEGQPGADDLGAIYGPKYKGKITVPNNPIQIADAALYL